MFHQIQCYHTHIEEKNKQRAAFQDQINNLQHGQAILCHDFMANAILGHSRYEENRDYYIQPQRSIYTAIVFYLSEDCTIKQIVFTVVSDDLTHNALFVANAFNLIFSKEQWKEHHFSSLSIWSDNGPAHFRSHEFVYWVTKHLGSWSGCNTVTLNYFVEYHGENPYDAHFSKVRGKIEN